MKIKTAVFALSLIMAFVMMSSISWSLTQKDDFIPQALKQWKPWVLYGLEEHFCPTQFDQASGHICTWPSRLLLDLNQKGGRFEQEWLVFTDAWVPLPGGKGNWPKDIKVNDENISIVGRKDVPRLFLTPGKHHVDGIFQWDDMPEMIHIPPESGLITLKIKGKFLYCSPI